MNKLGGIVGGYCPKCRTGKVFKNPFFKFKKQTEMNENCSNCGLKFEVEPGFFWGAMYFSYGFNVAFITTISILISFFTDNASIWLYMVWIVSTIFIFSTFIYRYSRLLMLTLFGGITYNESLDRKNQSSTN